MMCQAWSDFVEARRRVAETKTVFKTPKGFIAKNPMLTVMNEAFDRWRKLAGQFGLTPSARASLSIDRKNPDENRGRQARYFTDAG